MGKITRVEAQYLYRPEGNEPLLSVPGFGNPSRALQDLFFDPTKSEAAGRVIHGFAIFVEFLRKTEGIVSLCFLQIEGRPVGALAMLQPLISEVGLPAWVWTRKESCGFQGYHPAQGDRIAFVSDACITGGTLIEAAGSLKHELKLTPVAAVVYLNELRPPILDCKEFKLPLFEVARATDNKDVTWRHGGTSQEWISSAGGVVRQASGFLTRTPEHPSLVPEKGVESAKEDAMPDEKSKSPTIRLVIICALPLIAATALTILILGSKLPLSVVGALLISQVLLSVFGVYLWFKLIKR